MNLIIIIIKHSEQLEWILSTSIVVRQYEKTVSFFHSQTFDVFQSAQE